jgi:hypothetical protein
MIRTYLALTPADRRLVWEAAALVALMRAALSVMPFESVRRLASRLGRMPAGAADADRVAWAVRAAGRRLGTCLPQALAAQVMLARRGKAPVLRIGVARDNGAVAAHAWVEVGGRVVVGGTAAPYAPLLEIAG